MTVKKLEQKAKRLRQELGGTVFAFPINEEDPFSDYAVVVYAGGMFHTYPRAKNINEAALGVKTILEEMAKQGYTPDFKRDVRFITYEAQVNAPIVTMRRLKKDNLPSPPLMKGTDVSPIDGGEYAFSARGLIKFSYLSMVEEKLPKAAQFMDEYYKLLAMRKYGKTAAAIKQEVRKMTKEQAIKWIERTYSRFIRDDMEVMDIMQRIAASSS